MFDEVARYYESVLKLCGSIGVEMYTLYRARHATILKQSRRVSMYSSFIEYLTYLQSLSTLTAPSSLRRLMSHVRPWDEMPIVEASAPWDIRGLSRMVETALRVVSLLRVEMTSISSMLNLLASKYRRYLLSFRDVRRPWLVRRFRWYWTTPTGRPRPLHTPLKWTPGLPET